MEEQIKNYMNNPKVTVITVCYNAVSLLEDTMKSVLSQTYDNIEYIIIDGASTDGTQEIIKKYEDNLDFWISEPDKGIYDAMNKGLLKATGEWIAFMNAGDTYVDDSVIYDIFDKMGRVYSDSVHDKKVKVIGGHITNHYNGESEVHFADYPGVIPYKIPICHQASFTRRILGIGNCPFQFNTKYKIAADYQLFYDIYYSYDNVSSFSIVDRIIANCRQDDSTTFLNLKEAKGEYLAIQASHRSWQWWKEYIKWRCF